MDDDMLMQVMEQKENTKDKVIVAEFNVSSFELHKIAKGNCKVFGSDDSQFGVRVLLRNSFKSPKSNHVVNNFVLQVVVAEKKGVLKKEEIAVKTKVVKRDEKTKTESKHIEVKVNEAQKELF